MNTTPGKRIWGRFFVVALLATLVVAARGLSEEPSPILVANVFIIGNTKTRQEIIVRQLPFYPGQVLDEADLRKAEGNLLRLNRFVVNPEKGIRPTVTILEDPNDPKSEYKDVLVTVVEKEKTNLFDTVCDGLDEWGYLVDIRFPAGCIFYLYDAILPLN